MNYRSDVTIAINKKVYDKHKLLSNFPEMLLEDYAGEVTQGKDIYSQEIIILNYYNIRWDAPIVSEIAEVKDFLNNIDPKSYAFVKFGENWEDLEIEGDSYVFNIEIARTAKYIAPYEGAKCGIQK